MAPSGVMVIPSALIQQVEVLVLVLVEPLKMVELLGVVVWG